MLKDSLKLPSTIGRFRIVEELGRGAMGVVYRAVDPLLERTVAIKTIPLDLPEAERTQFEERFQREAKSAGRLSHPNIVTIYDVGEAGDVAYIAMEYLRGQSLKDILDQHGSLPLDLALDTAIQMADALAFAHEHGIVHRDVKPGNVIVLEDRGAIKLTDFGIAHINAAQSETRAGVLVGSPRYMAPEQITGKPLDGRTDVFSAGVVLYEMLTGQAPFTAPDLHMLLYRIVNETPPLASRLRADIPAEVDRLLARCLAKQPNLRPASARELYLELKKIAALFAAKQPGGTNPRRVRRLALFAFSIPILVFLVLFLGLVVINYFITREPTLATAPAVAPTAPVPLAKADKTGAAANSPAGSAHGSRRGPAGPQVTQQTPDNASDAYLVKLDKKLAELRVKRAEMLSSYTELHPDVVLLNRQIERLENERDEYLSSKRQGLTP
ncbi:MAG TPA: protein kinase [Thiobacillaceae bacterium]|nr:protein kinase [Thiobacillaceae bacterium]